MANTDLLLRLKEAATALNAALEYREVLVANGLPCTDERLQVATLQQVSSARKLLWAVEDLLRVSGVQS
jgi:hypothetical protein